jgi:hypothetical protein
MKPRKTRIASPSLPPWLIWLERLSLGCAVVVLFGWWNLDGGDFFWWLIVGRWMGNHRWPPTTDMLSSTTPGHELIAHSWGAGLMSYVIDHAAGVQGLMLLRLALVSTALGFAWQTGRLFNAPSTVLVVLSAPTLWVVWGWLDYRPQLWTTMLLALQLWLLMSVHTGRRSWRWLWTLPPLYVFWVNVHGGWIQEPMMLAAAMGALALMVWRDTPSPLRDASPAARG